MYSGAMVFSQLMQQLPWRRFQTIVDHYQGDYKVQTFRCSEHFRVMAFAQLTYRESLRDIEACLRAMEPKLYHMGVHSTVSRNNLSNANENRDWRIYAEFAQVLIRQARTLYAGDSKFPDLDATVYALDSSTIDLCMTLFPWAHFRRTKSAVKMHTLLNLCGNIPEFILITEGNVHDVNVLDHIIPLPGAYYVMDRAYLDFERLYTLHTLKAYFVTRAKKNFQFRRRYSHPVDRSLFRHQRERGQNTDLDSHLRLPPRGHHKEAAENRPFALHNSTDFECVRFRENTAITGLSEDGSLKRRWRLLQPVVAVGLILGH